MTKFVTVRPHDLITSAAFVYRAGVEACCAVRVPPTSGDGVSLSDRSPSSAAKRFDLLLHLCTYAYATTNK